MPAIPPNIVLKFIEHRGAERIGIFFNFDSETIQYVKKLGAQWSQTRKCWHIVNSTENYRMIRAAFPDVVVSEIDDKTLNPVQAPGLQNNHDNAPIAIPEKDSALPPVKEAEHNPSKADDKTGCGAIFQSITGKYWVVKVPYSEHISKALKMIKGVYWNGNY
jgi:hypothetical protein